MACTDCTHDGTSSLRAPGGVGGRHSARLWSLTFERTRPALARLFDAGAGRRPPSAGALDEAWPDRAQRHRSRKPAHGQRPQHRNEWRSHGSGARQPNRHHELTMDEFSGPASERQPPRRGRLQSAEPGDMGGGSLAGKDSRSTSSRSSSRLRSSGAVREAATSSRRASGVFCCSAVGGGATGCDVDRPSAVGDRVMTGMGWFDMVCPFRWVRLYVDRTRGETRPTRARNAPPSCNANPARRWGSPPASVTAR